MAKIDERKIISIATEVATANLGSSSFADVRSNPTIDSMGREALQITIVLTPGSSAKVTGEAAANTVSDINQKLQDAGEERFSIVRYST
jgi:hypothetical protein